jgi:pimeloyl-ACP methyl ester carboxylesterase
MPQAKRDGLTLHYERAGGGDPPFVFVPGWCCDHTFFQPQFDYFKSSHSVISLDLRGCGSSGQPQDGYDIPTLADDVAWLCRHLDLEKPVLVGHSLGGMIGIDLAARYPDLPGAIVAVDPGPIDPKPEARGRFETLLAGLEGTEGETVRRDYIEGLFLPTDDLDRKRSILAAMCSPPQRIAAEVIRGVIAWNGVEALQRCKVPLLILLSQLGGSNDPSRLLPLKSDITFGVTVGTGHFNHLDAPEQVTSMI